MLALLSVMIRDSMVCLGSKELAIDDLGIEIWIIESISEGSLLA